MRIATIDLEGTPTAALVEDDAVRPLPGVAILDALAGAIGEAGEPIALGDVRLLSPSSRPRSATSRSSSNTARAP